MQQERISILQQFRFAERTWEVRNIDRRRRLVLIETIDGNRTKRVVLHYNAMRMMRRVG